MLVPVGRCMLGLSLRLRKTIQRKLFQLEPRLWLVRTWLTLPEIYSGRQLQLR